MLLLKDTDTNTDVDVIDIWIVMQVTNNINITAWP